MSKAVAEGSAAAEIVHSDSEDSSEYGEYYGSRQYLKNFAEGMMLENITFEIHNHVREVARRTAAYKAAAEQRNLALQKLQAMDAAIRALKDAQEQPGANIAALDVEISKLQDEQQKVFREDLKAAEAAAKIALKNPKR